MAVNVIIPSNSRTVQLVDLDASPTLFLGAGAYIIESIVGHPAYFATGGGAHVTINGTLMAVGAGALYLGQNESPTVGGFNTVTVGATGQLVGKSGLSVFGGSNVVSNAGTISGNVAQGAANTASNVAAGIYALGDGNVIVNTGTISGFYGIYAPGSENQVINSGTITGVKSPALQSGASLSLTNTGDINGDVVATSGLFWLINHGVIDGGVMALFTDDENNVTNYGAINGTIRLGSSNDTVDNYGTISTLTTGVGRDHVTNYAGAHIGSVFLNNFSPDSDANSGDIMSNFGVVASVDFDNASDFFFNDGTVTSTVSMNDGANYFVNSGVARSLIKAGSGADTGENYGAVYSIDLGDGADRMINGANAIIHASISLGGASDTSIDAFINAGIVGIDLNATFPGFATVSFGDGADTFTNTGTVYGLVDMGAGNDADALTNSGLIAGNVNMGAGNDSVDTTLGQITGPVSLGTGNDAFAGGAAIDRVKGDVGFDTIDLGGGDDVDVAANNDGNDLVDGGAGIDTYNAASVTLAFTIDLDAGATSGGVGVDAVLNFENVVGGSGADTLTGSSGANRIDGAAGADTIDGGAGDDRLVGNVGSDTIIGGAGRDVMTGGSTVGSKESDTFVFADSDTGATASTRDVITDFTDHGAAAAPFAAGADTIDLHLMDADTTLAGDQAFSFNPTAGAAFSGGAGSLIWAQRPAFALVMGDTNGDKIADFAIQLNGTHTLFASDFVL